jgi:hypothetical protein
VAGRWVVDDAEAVSAGQVRRSDFLAALRTSVRRVADEVLANIGQTASDCPYIERWFGFYEKKNARHIEQAIVKYAPGAVDGAGWKDVVRIVADRVRDGFQRHVDTGSMDGVPAEMADGAPPLVAGSSIQRCGPTRADLVPPLRAAPTTAARRALLQAAYGRGPIFNLGAAAFIEYLNGCTAAAHAVGTYFRFDVDRDAPNTSTNFTSMNLFVNNLLVPQGHSFYHCVNTGGPAHEWSVIKAGGRYDLCESDANPAVPIPFGGGQTGWSLDAAGILAQLVAMVPRLQNHLGVYAFTAKRYSLAVPL